MRQALSWTPSVGFLCLPQTSPSQPRPGLEGQESAANCPIRSSYKPPVLHSASAQNQRLSGYNRAYISAEPQELQPALLTICGSQAVICSCPAQLLGSTTMGSSHLPSTARARMLKSWQLITLRVRSLPQEKTGAASTDKLQKRPRMTRYGAGPVPCLSHLTATHATRSRGIPMSREGCYVVWCVQKWPWCWGWPEDDACSAMFRSEMLRGRSADKLHDQHDGIRSMANVLAYNLVHISNSRQITQATIQGLTCHLVLDSQQRNCSYSLLAHCGGACDRGFIQRCRACAEAPHTFQRRSCA